MTHNIFVKCDVCGSIIDLKWQIGYLPKNIFKVTCGKCKTVIEGTLNTNNHKPSFSYEIINAKEIHEKIDFNCDYIIPISGEILTEKMKDGKEQFMPTPFINIVSIVNIENFSMFNQRFLKGMERIEKFQRRCDRLNELYINKEYNYLKKMLKEDFDINIKKKNYLNICQEKYKIDINFYESFVYKIKYSILKKKIFKNYKKLKSTNRTDYFKLLEYFQSDIDKYEKRIKDTLNIFINNYNYFIPILLLEYTNENIKKEICKNYAITTVDFENVRNLYLRIYENIIEVSPLFVSLNNIIYRNNFAEIDNLIMHRKNSIEDYKKLSKGNKIKYLNTDEIFNLIFPKFDKDIRNAIGHEDIEYDAFNQKLSFEGGEIYLIEYVYNTWTCYSLCCIIYEIILDMKFNILKTFNKNNK